MLRVTVGDRFFVVVFIIPYVMSFEPRLTPLFVDSAQVLWASFCFVVSQMLTVICVYGKFCFINKCVTANFNS